MRAVAPADTLRRVVASARRVGPLLTVVLAAAVVGAVIGEFPDLHVYRYGGHGVLDQWRVYASDDPVTGYPFTYPPFAAVVMVPLTLLPGWLAAALWTAVSATCLAATVVVVRRALGRPTPAWLVVLVGLGSLALEPVWQNFAFGQINLVLMLAVLVDLVRPERRWSGVLVGLAAGVKLTPLVFVVLLVLIGQRGAAARASLVFVGTVAVGLVAVPGATTYWTDGLLEADRVGPPALAHNQSVFGALTRLLDESPPTWLWLAVAGPLAVAMLLAAASWWRRGERGARDLPGGAGDAARLAGLVVAPLGVGGAGGAGAVGAQPRGQPPPGPRSSWRGPSSGRPGGRAGSSTGAGSTTSSATPTSSPPSRSASGRASH